MTRVFSRDHKVIGIQHAITSPRRVELVCRDEIAGSQLCGLGHYRLRGVVRVVSAGEFSRWLAAQRP